MAVLAVPAAGQGRTGSYIYSSAGFGGLVPAARPAARHGTKPWDLQLDALYRAYGAGRYADAVTSGSKFVDRSIASKDLSERRAAVYASLVVAYAAARQKNMLQASDWFERTRLGAVSLPDHGARPHKLGPPVATLEEEAVFQHAVCSGALGYAAEAEHEYVELMKRYPESPLVHGAVKRIAKFHGGDVPPYAEKVWKDAMKAAQAREKARRRERSMCGPECVAELLRRAGKRRVPQVHALAVEMKCDQDGTSVGALVAALRKHGVSARGLALTRKGLQVKAADRSLHLVALVTPGHYVLVESVRQDSVTVWDPNAKGIGKPGVRTETDAQWGRDWSGVAVAVGSVGRGR